MQADTVKTAPSALGSRVRTRLRCASAPDELISLGTLYPPHALGSSVKKITLVMTAIRICLRALRKSDSRKQHLFSRARGLLSGYAGCCAALRS